MERVEQSLNDFVSQMTQHLQYPPSVHQSLCCFILTLLQSKNMFTVEQLLSVDDFGSLLRFQQDWNNIVEALKGARQDRSSKQQKLDSDLPQLVGRTVVNGALYYLCCWKSSDTWQDVTLSKLMETYGNDMACVVEQWDGIHGVVFD